MTKKEKWKILLDGLNLKVGDEIVITDCHKHFSNSVKNNRYVRFTYKPHIYKIAEEERNYYLVEKYKDEYLDDGNMYGAHAHDIWHILDDFDRIEDAKFLKETTVVYPTRDDYYRAHPEANIWKYENSNYPGDEDKLQTYYEVAKDKGNCCSYWNSFQGNKTEGFDDDVVIRMRDKDAFIKRINNLHLKDYVIRTVQTIMDLEEK